MLNILSNILYIVDDYIKQLFTLIPNIDNIRLIIRSIFYLFISLIIILYIWIKLYFQFWSRQPVFHYHNLWHWLFPPGIIQQNKPKLDKYYDIKIPFKEFINY